MERLKRAINIGYQCSRISRSNDTSAKYFFPWHKQRGAAMVAAPLLLWINPMISGF